MIFRPPSRFINRCLATGLVFAMAAAISIPVSAQQRVGGSTSPNVVVDYSVLEQLGRTPNIADVLGGGRLAAPAARSPYTTRELQFPIVSGRSQNALPGQIKLRPPSAARTGSTKRQSPRRLATPKAPTRPATITARRAAPTTRGVAPTPLRPPSPPSIAALPANKPLSVPTPPSAPKAPTAPSIARAASPVPPPVPSLPAATVAPRSTPGIAGESITPPPAPALPSKAASTAVAALPPPSPLQSKDKLGVGSSLRVGFAAGSAKLDPPAETDLKRVADALKDDEALRIQLLAYAGSTGNTASQARRLSLSRALAARSTLINQGVKSARIDVRALGNQAAGGPPDRIDIIVTKR